MLNINNQHNSAIPEVCSDFIRLCYQRRDQLFKYTFSFCINYQECRGYRRKCDTFKK